MKLLERLDRGCRTAHLASSTREQYLRWVDQFLRLMEAGAGPRGRRGDEATRRRARGRPGGIAQVNHATNPRAKRTQRPSAGADQRAAARPPRRRFARVLVRQRACGQALHYETLANRDVELDISSGTCWEESVMRFSRPSSVSATSIEISSLEARTMFCA